MTAADQQTLSARVTRRLPIGAETAGGRIDFRVWAPDHEGVQLVIESPERRAIEMTDDAQGYFAASIDDPGKQVLYRFRLDGEDALLPDPASRFQPEGPHGPSEVIDPSRFAWTDGDWPGVGLEGRIIYEMHVGTFTPEGTWLAAARQLPELAAAGIDLIEMMPIADFPGRFGWGYDGVDLFAPTRLYGRPDDLRSFIDTAHSLGIGVILDVVYNHLGPDGNYLKAFSQSYFTDRYKCEWGDAINYELVTSPAVVDELERGEYASRRECLELIEQLPLLAIEPAIMDIVDTYIARHVMPAEPAGDALHLALASFHRCDFLVTWNCRHLANANKFGHIRRVNTLLGLYVPILVTPLELLSEKYDEA